MTPEPARPAACSGAPGRLLDQWRAARTDKRGITINARELADNGYTLYTSAGGSYASLINMQGKEVPGLAP
ncbi:MAG: hypothetical protein PF501_18325 [Salinisphaera sp.]|jgi:hypothetical protein|nr:hypothetical protein [Salinisphaera sp.]